MDKDSRVLYPDPPLGDEELEEFKSLPLNIVTPLQQAAEDRTLAEKTIILSISESGDSERYGLTPQHLDAALHEISLHLLVRGATLEYGGHLGSAGYTTALFEMVRTYTSLSNLPPAERIINDVGWPLPLETLPLEKRAQYQGVATFRRIPRPDGVADLEPETFVEEPEYFPADSPERRYAWARGMTAMRSAQAESKDVLARILLGGKIGPTISVTPKGKRTEKWYSGRIPGLVEEALLSLRAGQPVYLIGAFGGAAALVIDLLEGREREEFTWEYQSQAPHAPRMRTIYEDRGPEWEDCDQMAAYFHEQGATGLSEQNRLTEDENRELFATRDIHRLVELQITGMTRLGS